MLQALVVGMVLIAVGVTIGLMVGLRSSMENSGTSGSSQPLLRAGGDTVRRASDASAYKASQPKIQQGSGPIDLTGKSLEQRKQAFLAHIPEIGTKGAFPYYPDGAKLVETTHDFSTFRAPGGKRFEEWKHGDSPYIYQVGESDELARSRQYHIKKAMQFAWAGYEQYAFGMDEIKPESMTGSNGWGGFGTTLVDSLDTLWLMGMKDEFQRARDWVRDSLNNDRNHVVSFFETTIRSVGGLLSGTNGSLAHPNHSGASTTRLPAY